jgi:two-component system, LytTR family, sensor kinase
MTDNMGDNKRILSKTELYLPYLYPILMPVLTLFSFKIPIRSVQEGFRYWLFTWLLQLMILWVVQKAVYSTAYNKGIRWLIAACVCLCIIAVYWFLEINYIHFIERFANPQKWIHALRNSVNILILIALLEAIKSYNDRSKLKSDNIILQKENVKAQFNQLMQQINPHFLFNCLTTLQAMVRSKDVRTEEFIIKLKDVYQQTLKKETSTVTLQEELDFFKAYIFLIKLRQEDAVFLDIQVQNNALALYLPTFSLQLLAENCIKHNIVSMAKPLYIRVYQKDPKSLTISNNYQPKKVKSESFGIGLQNLKKRYALAGIEQGIVIKQDEKTYETTLKLL